MTKGVTQEHGTSVAVERSRSANEFAALIIGAYKKAVSNIIRVGALLIEAKAALPHGQFEKMVLEQMPFGPGSARHFMSIARNEWIARHKQYLPTTWSTLAILSRVPPRYLDQALNRGVIRPDMCRAEALALKRRSFLPPPAELQRATDDRRKTGVEGTIAFAIQRLRSRGFQAIEIIAVMKSEIERLRTDERDETARLFGAADDR